MRGKVTATSNDVCFPCQFWRKMSPGRVREFATAWTSLTGERPACLAESKMASRIMSWRWMRSLSDEHVMV